MRTNHADTIAVHPEFSPALRAGFENFYNYMQRGDPDGLYCAEEKLSATAEIMGQLGNQPRIPISHLLDAVRDSEVSGRAERLRRRNETREPQAPQPAPVPAPVPEVSIHDEEMPPAVSVPDGGDDPRDTDYLPDEDEEESQGQDPRDSEYIPDDDEASEFTELLDDESEHSDAPNRRASRRAARPARADGRRRTAQRVNNRQAIRDITGHEVESLYRSDETSEPPAIAPFVPSVNPAQAPNVFESLRAQRQADEIMQAENRAREAENARIRAQAIHDQLMAEANAENMPELPMALLESFRSLSTTETSCNADLGSIDEIRTSCIRDCKYIYVCGDIHGDASLLKYFCETAKFARITMTQVEDEVVANVTWEPSVNDIVVVLLGDYVDRTRRSDTPKTFGEVNREEEIIQHLINQLALKAAEHRSHVIRILGNHELWLIQARFRAHETNFIRNHTTTMALRGYIPAQPPGAVPPQPPPQPIVENKIDAFKPRRFMAEAMAVCKSFIIFQVKDCLFCHAGLTLDSLNLYINMANEYRDGTGRSKPMHIYRFLNNTANYLWSHNGAISDFDVAFTGGDSIVNTRQYATEPEASFEGVITSVINRLNAYNSGQDNPTAERYPPIHHIFVGHTWPKHDLQGHVLELDSVHAVVSRGPPNSNVIFCDTKASRAFFHENGERYMRDPRPAYRARPVIVSYEMPQVGPNGVNTALANPTATSLKWRMKNYDRRAGQRDILEYSIERWQRPITQEDSTARHAQPPPPAQNPQLPI
jgi:hypothetical protein